MKNLIWLIPVLPLLGFLINGIGNRNIPRNISGLVASLTVLGSFVVSVVLFSQLLSSEQLVITSKAFTWIPAGSFEIEMGLMADRLTGIMLLVVTGVGFLIHVYSMGYMHDETDYARYFAYLNLFVFFI